MSLTTARNIGIIALLAALVAFAPGGGTGSSVVLQVLSIAFLASIAFFGYRAYREHRVALFGLGDVDRGILYGSVALAVLALTGISYLWNSGPGTLAWFLMVGAAAAGFFRVLTNARRY